MTDRTTAALAKVLGGRQQIQRPPAGSVRRSTGTLLTWNPSEWRGTVRWQGTIIEDVPVIDSLSAFGWAAGDEVVIDLVAGDGGFASPMIGGRVFRPGAQNAQKVLQSLQSELVSTIIDEIVEELLNSEAGETLINGIVENLLTSPAGEELAAFAIGARVHSATVAASQSTSSTSFTDLATAGPSVSSVSISDRGRAVVIVTADTAASSQAGSSGQIAEMSFAISGATTVAADLARSQRLSFFDIDTMAFANVRASAASLVTGLNAGDHTFTAKYRKSAGGGSVNFADRNIVVIAL